ncbi:single-stranded DNA-binding protein [Candidatus Peregrinibacteria bacterium]|nr:single-stranded DNA-binding protein [Candidatus Peregrinibacteria bacterium]
MRTLNKVIIIGNLTRDPKIATTQNNQIVCTFGIATNRDWVSNGEKKQSSEFHEVAAWSRLGEICAKFLKKGKLVYLEGYLKTRSWDDEAGGKKFRTEIVLQDMVMLEKRSSSEADDEILEASGEEMPAEEDTNMF